MTTKWEYATDIFFVTYDEESLSYYVEQGSLEWGYFVFKRSCNISAESAEKAHLMYIERFLEIGNSQVDSFS